MKLALSNAQHKRKKPSYMQVYVNSAKQFWKSVQSNYLCLIEIRPSESDQVMWYNIVVDIGLIIK